MPALATAPSRRSAAELHAWQEYRRELKGLDGPAYVQAEAWAWARLIEELARHGIQIESADRR